jgi:hypothetical protein
MVCAATSAHAADLVYAGDLTPVAQTGSAGGYSWFDAGKKVKGRKRILWSTPMACCWP